MIGIRTWNAINEYLDTLSPGERFCAKDCADYVNNRPPNNVSHKVLAYSNILRWSHRVRRVEDGRVVQYEKVDSNDRSCGKFR